MSKISIGIDENTSLLFEGTVTNYAHAVWPNPLRLLGLLHRSALGLEKRLRSPFAANDADAIS
jgi:hypothetical protein